MDFMTITSSLSAALDLTRALVDERDRHKAAAIQADLTDKIIHAQAQLSQILGTVIEQQGRIAFLEKRIGDMQAAAAEKARYKLTKVGTVGDFFAYQLCVPAEGDEGSGEAVCFFCQPCLDAGKKIVLTGNGEGYWCCSGCKHGANTGHAALAYTIPRNPNRWR